MNKLFERDDLKKLYIPILIEILLTVSVGVADTMMVSQAGETAVSGVSCFNTIQNFLIALFSAFATGGSVVIGQMLGMGNTERAKNAVKDLMYLTLAVSLALGLVFIFLKEPLLRIIYGESEEAVIVAALDYALPILISLPFLASQSSLNAILRVQGKTKTTMWTSIAANIINVVGNAIFILVFNLGAVGVGIATLISRIISALILFIASRNKNLKAPFEKILQIKH
ncbi:MAG: MATE family efflux transporter, partial [Spirochaetales bacterium]|nr:MATE family efflux transporter [Spirochaetales bacterium]